MMPKIVIILRKDEQEIGRSLRRWFAIAPEVECRLWSYDKNGSIKGDDEEEKSFNDTLDINLFVIFKTLKFLSGDGKLINLLREIWKFQSGKNTPSFSHAILFSFDNPLDLLKYNLNENNLILSDGLMSFRIPFELQEVEKYLDEIKEKSLPQPEKYLDTEDTIDSHSYRNFNAVIDFFRGVIESGEVPLETIETIKNDLSKKLLPWDFRRRQIDNIIASRTQSFRYLSTKDKTEDKILLIDDTEEWGIILNPIFASRGWELISYKDWGDSCKENLKKDFNIRIVLLDMMIKSDEKRGKDILDKIRAIRLHIPVVLFSVSNARILFELFKEGNIDDLYFKETSKGQYKKLMKYVEDNIKVSRVIEPFQQRINILEHKENSHYKSLIFNLEQSALYLKKALRLKLYLERKKRGEREEDKEIIKSKGEDLKANIKASMYFSGLASDKIVNILPYIKGFPSDTKAWEDEFEADDKKEFYPCKQYRTIVTLLRNFTAHPAVSINHFEIDDALIFLSITLKMAEHYCFSKNDNPSILSFINSRVEADDIVKGLEKVCKDLRLPDPHNIQFNKLREIIGNALSIYIQDDKNRKSNVIWKGLPCLPFNNPNEEYYLRCVPYLADISYLEKFEECKNNVDDEDQRIYALIASRINEDNILNNYLKPNDEDKS